MLSFNPTDRYHYYLDVLEPISIDKYIEYPTGQGAALLTEKMQQVLEARRELDPERPKWT